jgi:hypothetical protein
MHVLHFYLAWRNSLYDEYGIGYAIGSLGLGISALSIDSTPSDKRDSFPFVNLGPAPLVFDISIGFVSHASWEPRTYFELEKVWCR